MTWRLIPLCVCLKLAMHTYTQSQTNDYCVSYLKILLVRLPVRTCRLTRLCYWFTSCVYRYACPRNAQFDWLRHACVYLHHLSTHEHTFPLQYMRLISGQHFVWHKFVSELDLLRAFCVRVLLMLFTLLSH